MFLIVSFLIYLSKANLKRSITSLIFNTPNNRILTLFYSPMQRESHLLSFSQQPPDPLPSPPPTPSPLQGQVQITSSIPLQFHPLSYYLYMPLLSLITCGAFLLLVSKSARLRSRILYRKATINTATHYLIRGNDRTYEIVPVSDEHTIMYRKVKYRMNSGRFGVVGFEVGGWRGWRGGWQGGLTEGEYRENLRVYGRCEHRVDIPTIWEYLGEQLLGIFFILQYIICAIYLIQQFYLMAAVMVAFSIITTIINYYLLRSSMLRIKQIAQRTFPVQVYRNNMLLRIDSTDLVPGDIYIPEKSDHGIPCDSIIIKGELYLNQASLTGENVPIEKTPPGNFGQTETKNCWLSEGAEVLEGRGEVLALVVHTGFLTRKGRIIRKIIHKTQVQPQFIRNGFYLLMQLLIYCLILFFIMIPTMAHIQITQKLFILRFFDMLGWVLPPTFPIFFNICYSLSLYRLRKLNIFGTEPLRTTISGKVKTMCFDKTGTLTENRMQLAKVIRFQEGVFGDEHSIQQKDQNDLGAKLFASCHTVRRIEGEFMGDELDLRMFLYSEFEYQPSNQLNVKLYVRKNDVVLEVIRINQFESRFQSMSVLVKDVKKDAYYVFVKGAPEKIRDLSVVKYKEFDGLVAKLSLAGLRNLAFGYKEVKDPKPFLNMPREDFEKDIRLFGIVTFENKLKHDTRSTILMLKQAQMEVKIITGDNIYIGIQTAIRAGIINPTSKILVFQGDHQPPSSPFYHGQLLQRINSQTTSQPATLTYQQFSSQPHPIVIDNKFFNLNPVLVTTIKVFARISPENKAKVILKLKQQKEQEWKSRGFMKKYFGKSVEKVGMVGDGANDILAIKEADLGVGISETDSSFAAHFTICNVEDVERIMREGRSNLMIIIQIFRYYTIISLLKFVVQTLMSIDKSSYSDNQFLYLNYAGILQIVLLFCLSHPCRTLSPFIPDDNFLSLQNHLVILGQILISTFGMVLSYYLALNSGLFIFNPDQPYTQWVFQCHTNTVLFLTSQMYMIFCAIWVYTSRPWKERIWRNWGLVGWLGVVAVGGVVMFWQTGNLEVFFGLVDVGEMVAEVFWVTVGFVGIGGVWGWVVKRSKLYKS